MLLAPSENTTDKVYEMRKIKTYSELITLPTFEERFEYLKLHGRVGAETFGYERYLNQILYNSYEWKTETRPKIILRDEACDLACPGFDIPTRILIHHINPITVDDVLNRNPKVFDPDNLICVSHKTHQAIHYGDESLLTIRPIERTRNDTCPWRNM